MTVEEKKRVLIEYRLTQARESLDELVKSRKRRLSRESGNPVKTNSSGFPLSRERREYSNSDFLREHQSLDEAKYLIEGNKSLRSVANRVYYAMFYAVLALLVNEPYSSSKHSGVLSYFNRRFIKDGVFAEDLGLALNRSFEMCQRGDYKEQVILDREQILQITDKAKLFIDAVEKFLLLSRNEEN